MATRRDLIGTLSLAGFAAAPLIATAQGAGSGGAAESPPALPSTAKVPRIEFIYECIVTLAPTLQFGTTVEGTRRVIPITGGTFEGPRMRGTVLAGGADWNLTRRDGAGSVDATYYLRTHDNVLIRITNQGVGGRPGGAPPDPDAPESFFMFTAPRFEAPAGPYDWLNRGMFVGTLGARKAIHNAVLIRAFELV